MITRIRELLDTRQLSPTQFADLIGVGRPVISHILSERNKPSLEVVQKIIGAFPDISLPWLLAGTGPMLAAEAVAPATGSSTSPPPGAAFLPDAAASPIPAAAPVPAPFISAAPAPASTGRAAAAPQPSTYPQPPKFRPAAAPTPLAAPRVSPAPTTATPNPEPAVPTAPPAAPVSEPSPAPVAVPPPTLPLPTTLVAAASTDLPPTTSPALPVAEAPVPGPDSAAPEANPAAALSFLGEPGKAIRRIVIFYRDGSFSDYLPEGQ